MNMNMNMNESSWNHPHCKKREVTCQSNIVDTSSSQPPTPHPLISKDTTPDDNDNRRKKKKKKKKKKRSRSVVRFSPKQRNRIYLADDYDRKPIELDVYECDGCSIKIIFGERYHCKECDYDLCHECGKIQLQTKTGTGTEIEIEVEIERRNTHEHEHSNWEIIPPDDDNDDEDDDDKNSNNVGVDDLTAGIYLKTPSCS